MTTTAGMIFCECSACGAKSLEHRDNLFPKQCGFCTGVGLTVKPVPTGVAAVPAEGLKYDETKVPLHLLPQDSLIEVAKVLDFGARKYAPYNWMKGISYHRLFRASIGHLFSWWRGEDLDDETGLPHLAHAACCVLFMLHYAVHKEAFSKFDDRVDIYGEKR